MCLLKDLYRLHYNFIVLIAAFLLGGNHGYCFALIEENEKNFQNVIVDWHSFVHLHFWNSFDYKWK